MLLTTLLRDKIPPVISLNPLLGAKQDPSFKEKLKNWSLSLANKGAEVSIGEIAK